MEVGGHSWSHRPLGELSIRDAWLDTARAQRALAALGPSRLFRAPFGAFLPEHAEVFRELGVRPIHWSIAVDHLVGGLGLSPRGAARTLVAEVRPGDIVLLYDAPLGAGDPHDPRRAALRALALALPALERAGYRFVTVSELPAGRRTRPCRTEALVLAGRVLVPVVGSVTRSAGRPAPPGARAEPW